MGVGVLGTEDGTDLVDTTEIGSNGHLFCQLGRLGQECRATKVVDLEDTGSRFSGSTLQLGSVDFDETRARLGRYGTGCKSQTEHGR